MLSGSRVGKRKMRQFCRHVLHKPSTRTTGSDESRPRIINLRVDLENLPSRQNRGEFYRPSLKRDGPFVAVSKCFESGANALHAWIVYFMVDASKYQANWTKKTCVPDFRNGKTLLLHNIMMFCFWSVCSGFVVSSTLGLTSNRWRRYGNDEGVAFGVELSMEILAKLRVCVTIWRMVRSAVEWEHH